MPRDIAQTGFPEMPSRRIYTILPVANKLGEVALVWSNGVTVKVLRIPPQPSGRKRDRFGDSTGFQEHHRIANVAIEWESTTEPNPGERELVQSDITLYCPAGSDILASDRVELPDGDEYFVVGKPARWQSPFTGWQPGVVVKLRAAV